MILQTELSFAMVNRKPVVPGRIFFHYSQVRIVSVELSVVCGVKRAGVGILVPER